MRVITLKPPTTCPRCNTWVARDFARVVQVCPACNGEFKFMSSGRNLITIALPPVGK